MPAEPKTVEDPTGKSRIATARLGDISSGSVSDSDWIDVHFNPASLQLQISNQLKDADRGHPTQYIAKTTSKLTMDLQFDTTDSGTNVIQITRKIQLLVVPEGTEEPPPVVMFEWGVFTFKGVIESYSETTDYFS